MMQDHTRYLARQRADRLAADLAAGQARCDEAADLLAAQYAPRAVVTVAPDPTDPDAVKVEADSHGMNPAVIAHALRQVADRLDERALAAGDEPIPFTPTELAQGQADADALATEFPDTLAGLLDDIAEDIPNRRAHAIAADYLDRYARLLAQQITTLGSARAWSTWAADYIHPDRVFVDTGAEQVEEQPPPVEVGQTYQHKTDPRIQVKVTRVWTAPAADELSAAYDIHGQRDWRNRPYVSHSACRLSVFHSLYRLDAQAQR